MAPVEVTLRHLAIADRERAIDLLWQMNLHEDTIAGDRAVTREDAARCLARIERDVAQEGGAIILAEQAGTIVGLLGLLFSEGDPFVRAETRANGYVCDLVVDEAFRGLGIAQALLAEAEQRTRDQGYRTLTIGVLIGNRPAERAYERFGFVPQARYLLKRLG